MWLPHAAVPLRCDSVSRYGYGDSGVDVCEGDGVLLGVVVDDGVWDGEAVPEELPVPVPVGEGVSVCDGEGVWLGVDTGVCVCEGTAPPVRDPEGVPLLDGVMDSDAVADAVEEGDAVVDAVAVAVEVGEAVCVADGGNRVML